MTSIYDYTIAKELRAADHSFYALIMAAMFKADSYNMERLCYAFPEVGIELKQRYNSPGGLLPGETPLPHVTNR